LKNCAAKIGLVEWLKVKALGSNPSTAKKKKKKGRETEADNVYFLEKNYTFIRLLMWCLGAL
jgi:hypothetical protein